MEKKTAERAKKELGLEKPRRSKHSRTPQILYDSWRMFASSAVIVRTDLSRWRSAAAPYAPRDISAARKYRFIIPPPPPQPPHRLLLSEQFTSMTSTANEAIFPLTYFFILFFPRQICWLSIRLPRPHTDRELTTCIMYGDDNRANSEILYCTVELITIIVLWLLQFGYCRHLLILFIY